nr:hypothetical protein [Tanacetum cinerariifolium]
MRTRSQSRNNFAQQEASLAIVRPLRIKLPFLEDQFQEDPPVDPPEVLIADNRTMAEFLQAPTEGYEDAIVIPEIAANNFELKHVDPNCVTCGGTHSYQNCHATSENIYRDNIQEHVSQAAAANYNQGNIGFRPQMVANQIRPLGFPPHQNHQNNFNRGNNFNQNRGSVTLPSNTITNPKEDSKGITTRSGVAYQGPTIPTPSKVVKQGTKVTKDQVQTPSLQSTAPVQPPVIQSKTQTLVSEPVVAPVSVVIPYPLRRDNERRHDQANK